MKRCLSCNLEVGGQMEACPLCQNILTGEPTPYNWPTMVQLKKQAFLYKLQLFIVLAISVIALSLDFLIDLNNGKHWSIIPTVAVIIMEVMLRRFMTKNFVLARVINFSVLYATLIVVLAGWYYDFLYPIAYIVVPIIMGATLIANLVFSLIDKRGNAMVYLLCNILVGIVSYLFIEFSHRSRNLPWTICLMISVVTLIGIIVFKGRKVLSEIQKRMNI